MDPEAGSVTRESRLKFYKTTLCLAYQSFGVVYGDLSTSPIYVYKSTFSGRLSLHEEDDEILGVLSLVFWTLTLIPLCKYIIFVLGADDNGEGGTFALYSLLCRRAKLGLLCASNAPGDDISAYNSELPRKETVASSILKEFFDKYHGSRIMLLLLVLLGTSMVIGDGILTPSMSVLSAVNGIKIKATGLHENYTVFIACVILMGLFTLQHFGTRRVGFLFAPILLAWLFCISAVGVYNIIYWNPRVVSALSPYYVYNFFKKAGKDGWSSLGGIVLCITGAEAMFADLGHFSQLSIRIAFTVVVYPCLILAYMGEAAYLSKHKEDLQRSFYKSIPEVVFWPVFITATLATVVGSQAIISAIFSIISQCRALKCFPRVKVVHTSNHIHGQIYIPEVNWILMVLCLAVVAGYRDTDVIGNAYVPKVPANQRFVISRIGPPEFRLFHCVVRYGYKDQRKDSHDFENHLIETVADFLQCDNNDSELQAFGRKFANRQQSSSPEDVSVLRLENGVNAGSSKKTVRFRSVGWNKELEDLTEARESGLAYMMGSTCVLASETSSYFKKFVINIVYGFLRQNCRRPATALGVPHTSLIEVGMVYRV
ncbi:probable potassium transporter 13 isoform X2 [Durio zibethinus]|uniref:Potassium transporter n=1 Tax=Durio zibethinus TaxID=66656 RepID=A0A6P5WJ07_DURZI|nr:probable potassium transporter 13 isoform X2 [Durio zibethinus]